jgi:ketosteroid isomerase-like protein
VFTALDGGGGTYRGPEWWVSYFARMDDTWEDWKGEHFRVFDAGDDRVAAVFRMVGTGKSSGARVERAVGIAYWIRDGKIWRLRSYLDPLEALEAVGLSEQDAHADSSCGILRGRCRRRTWRPFGHGSQRSTGAM